ncbi:MAG: hypothetical protein WBC93_13015 [Sulfitobacter sp.]
MFTSNKMRSLLRKPSMLNATTALVTIGFAAPVFAQNCDLVNGALADDCTNINRGTSVSVPAQPNAEFESIPELSVDGFEISVDGAPVAQDGTIKKGAAGVQAKKRRQDLDLASTNVAVKFDGLDIRPRLDVETVGDASSYPTGSRITFQNHMNYPAFVRRGEVRIIDQAAAGGAQTVAVVPMDPNGRTSTQVPAGDDLVYVYRVYDAKGRYDETAPAVFGARRDFAADVEQGTDNTAVRRIPVFGGAVTVSGTNVRGDATVRTLGETVRPDAQGDFALQRILPTGAHTVNIDVAGGPSLARDIEVPASDLFYIGLVDVTIGKSLSNDLEDATSDANYDETFTRGRLAFYLKGKIKGEYLLTAAADTGEHELKNILRNFDEKNPRSLLDRIDPDEYYPVYGDDSTSEIDAPTAGKLYVKLEKDDSHVVWGNFKSAIGGTEYLRNERTLYGAQGVYRSPEQTSKGEARVELQLHAAQPETLPQRDVFRGTGGSAYFLKFQDITRGSETLLIEVVNPTTSRVISRRPLVYGVDYDINYVQGLVILRSPLSANGASSDLITSGPSGDSQAFLVANYDHTPTTGNVDSFSYGARAQTWVTDDLRLGATLNKENLGTSDQEAYGIDLLYQKSERTYLELEAAKTDGTGIAADTSFDGGLTLNTNAGATGSGRAYRFKGQVDLEDLGIQTKGVVGGYFEDRTAGFSTLNYRTNNDEQLWGFHFEIEPSDRYTLRAEYDDYSDSAGRVLKEGNLELAYKQTDTLTWGVGLETIDQNTIGDPTRTGQRTDAAVRLTYDPGATYSVYGQVQGTLSRSGGLSRNNRVGVGGEYVFSDQWRVSGEVSDGSLGFGARLLVNYDRDADNSYYFGYTLDPDRDFGGVTLSGRDKGSFVLGARQKINDDLNVYGENTYDLFGQHKSLTSNYGADYALNNSWTFTGGLEIGRITDPRAVNNSNFKRTAFSFGTQYKDENLSVRSRIEYRTDEGLISGADRNADTVAAELTARYKLNEQARLLFNLEGVRSANASASIPDAKYVEGSLGYALRPIDNDRLNVLAKYTYLYDMTQRIATIPGSGANFLNSPRQKAHVISLDASYDLNNNWTIGGKIGGRWSEQDSGAGFVSNNATLGVVNLRYHVVHKWDALLELRQLTAQDLGTDTGVLAALYRHAGNNFKIGVGYNFGRFSDDLRDVTYDDKGIFLNIVAKF